MLYFIDTRFIDVVATQVIIYCTGGGPLYNFGEESYDIRSFHPYGCLLFRATHGTLGSFLGAENPLILNSAIKIDEDNLLTDDGFETTLI
jgi:hypothetical protein